MHYKIKMFQPIWLNWHAKTQQFTVQHKPIIRKYYLPGYKKKTYGLILKETEAWAHGLAQELTADHAGHGDGERLLDDDVVVLGQTERVHVGRV